MNHEETPPKKRKAARQRADALVHAQGLAESREQARRLIMAGKIALEDAGLPPGAPPLKVDKPGHPYPEGTLFRLLENEEVEAVVGYQGQEGRRSSDGNYQEAGKVPLVCICPRTSPLSGRSSLRLGDLDGQRLILQDPIKCPPALSRLQGELVQDRAPSELYFCSGMDEALCLAQAGLGLALAPALLPPMEPLVAYLPVTEVPPLSFGAFFRTRKGTPHGRALLALLRERFSAPGAP